MIYDSSTRIEYLMAFAFSPKNSDGLSTYTWETRPFSIFTFYSSPLQDSFVTFRQTELYLGPSESLKQSILTANMIRPYTCAALLLQAFLVLTVECRFLPNSLGLPGAVRINGGGGSKATSPSNKGHACWTKMTNALPFRLPGKATAPTTGGEAVISSQGSITGPSVSQQLFLYPLILVVAAPYIAPFSEALSETISTVSTECLATFLELLKEIGVLCKRAAKAFANLQKISSTYTFMFLKIALEALDDLAFELRILLESIWIKASATLVTIASTSCNLATSSFGALCTAASKTKNGVGKSASAVSSAVTLTAKELVMVSVLTALRVAQGTKATCKFLSSTASKTKNGIVSCACKSASAVSSAAVGTARGVLMVSDLTASFVAKGTEATCKFVSSTAFDVAQDVLSLLNMSSSFIVYISETAWDGIVQGSYATAIFMLTIAEFVADSVAQCAEATGKFLSSTACVVAQEVVSAWEMSSSFTVYVSETSWNGIVAGSYATAKFTQTIAEFIADSVVQCTEMSCRAVAAAVRNTFQGLVWFKNKVPIWLNNLADKMPFLERFEDAVVLTPGAQSMLYVATAVAALHPSFKPIPTPSSTR